MLLLLVKACRPRCSLKRFLILQHKTVIYQPQVVQIGDKNIVHQGDSGDSGNSSDGEEKTSDISDTPVTDNKTVDKGETRLEEFS